MSLNIRLLQVVTAGVVCAALVTACSDRFGSYKSRRTSCVEYNEWAKKNNKNQICQPAGPLNKNGVPQDQTNPQMTRTQPTNKLDPKPGQGLSGGTSGAQTRPPGQGGNEEQQQPGVEVQVLPVGAVVDGPDFKDPYAKATWMTEFNKEIAGKNAGVPDLLKGITVTSGKEGGKAVFSVESIVIFNQKPHYLSIVLPTAEVKFDSKYVFKIKIQVKEKKESAPDARLRDYIYMSATCLAAPAAGQPCESFGILLDFKVPKDAATGLDRVFAYLKVETGVKTSDGINASAFNSAELKSFATAQALMPAETPVIPIAGPGVSPGAPVAGAGVSPGAPVAPGQPTTDGNDTERVNAAKENQKVVIEQNKIAVEQKRLAEIAKQSGKKDEAIAAAVKAEAAGKAAMEAHSLIENNLLKDLNSEAAKVEVAKIIAETKPLAAAAVKAGEEARELANQTGAVAAPTVSGGAPAGPGTVQPAPAISGGRMSFNTDPEGTADLLTREREAREEQEAEARRIQEMGGPH